MQRVDFHLNLSGINFPTHFYSAFRENPNFPLVVIRKNETIT